MAKKKTTKKSTSGKKKKQTRSSKKNKNALLGSIVKWMFVLGLWAGIVLAGVLAWYAQDLPDIAKSASFERQFSIIVKAADGTIIGRYGDVVGDSLNTTEFPPHLIQAVLATEDRRFYSHFGIDLIGLARAMSINIREGRVVQGGSTITQQLAKNLFLSRERTIKRKIQEAMLALWLEYKLDKDQILSAYLNRVYFGGGTYGVDAASKLYFNKPVTDVDLREAAMLAGLLKAPARYSPIHNPILAKKRSDVVINSMVDAGYIDDTEIDSLNSLPPRPIKKPGSEQNTERYFADWVVDGIDDLIGTPSEDIVIETTLNTKVQTLAEQALGKTIEEFGEEKRMSQGAVIVMRPNGSVVAMVGGVNHNQSQFNRAVQAKRQPGSAFKPFVYLTALKMGLTPDTLVIDEPITRGRYRPKNFGHKYYGEVQLSEALMLSLNTVSYSLMKHMGPEAVIETARSMGVFSPLTKDLSLALGTSVVAPLELVTAYSVIANGGMSVFPYAITKIESADGELYYQRPRYQKSRRVVDEDDIYDLTTMMRRVVEEGTGRGANIGVPAAGKTGTSQESRDAWFIGFTNELITGVWLGNDDNSPMKSVTGGSYPARIWREVMASARGQYNPVKIDGFTKIIDFQKILNKLIFSDDDPYGHSQGYDNRPYYQDWSPPDDSSRGRSGNNGGLNGGNSSAHESPRRYND